jgi:hypothetical protein
MVQVLNVSTGIYPRGGSSKLEGMVLALACDASGQLLWAGNNKVGLISFACVVCERQVSPYQWTCE